jgi:aminopeptidase N
VQTNQKDLLGRFFGFESGAAARDPRLPPGAKYTSGPYERSAWVISQLRSQMGEDSFWEFCRQILRDRKMKSAGLTEWKKALKQRTTPELVDQFDNSIRATLVPRISAKRLDNGDLEVIMANRHNALFAPFEFLKSNLSGTLNLATLVPNQTLVLEQGTKAIWNSSGVHPSVEDFSTPKEGLSNLTQTGISLNDPEMETAFVDLTVGAQQSVVYATQYLTPSLYSQFETQVKSNAVADILFLKACQTVSSRQTNLQEWSEVLQKKMWALPIPAFVSRELGTLSGCAALLPGGNINFEQGKFEFTNSKVDPLALTRFGLLMKPSSEALDFWAHLALNAKHMRARTVALDFLVRTPWDSFGLKKQYTDVLRLILSENPTFEMGRSLLPQVAKLLGPAELMGISLDILKLRSAYRIHRRAFCVGYLAAARVKAEPQFLGQLPKEEDVDSFLQELFRNPEQCR